MTREESAGTTHGRDPVDLGRRIAACRESRGLTQPQVAVLVETTPSYLQSVETGRATPNVEFLLRLADALETTVSGLSQDTGGRLPDESQAPFGGLLTPLTPHDCWSLLSTHGVGRIALMDQGVPAVMPVNYLVHEETLAYRTAPDSAAATAESHEVVFEADEVDEQWRRGWSVNMVGTPHIVRGPDARALDDRAYTLPWAGENRRLWLSMVPARITGRRVRVA